MAHLHAFCTDMIPGYTFVYCISYYDSKFKTREKDNIFLMMPLGFCLQATKLKTFILLLRVMIVLRFNKKVHAPSDDESGSCFRAIVCQI